MSGFWHPLSAVYLDRPRVLASPAVLRLMLAGEGRAELVYAGDRMWPALRHGQVLVVQPPAATPADGELVLAVEGGIPDVLRMVGGSAVSADADFGPPRAVAARDLLGRVTPAVRRRAPHGAIARLLLDVIEAGAHAPDPQDDPAATVREKYDDQSVHYDRLGGEPLEPALARRVAASVPPGSRVLVAGSGAGREAFALSRMGYTVSGVDFSPRMVDAARAEAKRIGSEVGFAVADLRSHDEPAGSLAAVVFTYDVYSFLSDPRAREETLARLRRWLAPSGVVFLSARRVQGLRDRALLSVQWLARALRGDRSAWGDSHTRWLDAAGNLRRSYVHVFTERKLRRESERAGFRCGPWQGGHAELAPGEAS